MENLNPHDRTDMRFVMREIWSLDTSMASVNVNGRVRMCACIYLDLICACACGLCVDADARVCFA